MIETVREFNRFYTRAIGVLPEEHLESPHSLAEVRVLYELAHRDAPTATDLARDLGFDGGYMSRIVGRLEEQRLLVRRRSASDGRQSLLTLTKKGKARFDGLDARARAGIGAMLEKVSSDDQLRLAEAMRTIESLLGERPVPGPIVLRAHNPGDLGWVVQRHGALYAQEYGWNDEFEALVARIVGEFVEHLDPKRERCWIAERDGENLGSIFLVKKSATVAKLRLLLVEPKARGTGLGSRLVAECERFARQAGYRKIVLWTQSNLLSARRIYERAGYRIIDRQPNHSFGKDLVSETWELTLS